MKLKTTFTFLIFSFFFCQNINSQSFVDEGNHWSMVEYTFAGIFSRTYKMEGDTTINGINYKKMLVTYENPNLAVNWGLSKIVREDSTQKVYQLNASNEEIVIYDFGLSVGDTIVSNISPEQNSIIMAVDSIELNDGTKRKRLTITSLYCPDWNIEEFWIEGIGGRNYAFYYVDVFCQTDTGLSLRCFSSNGDYLYGSTDGSNCYIPTSINNLEKTTIKIFPNPTQDILNLEYDEMLKIEELNILNFNGQVIKSFQVENGFSQINISDFPIGVYYLKIETVKSEFVFKKFIKL
jgi:hypothetical protein